MPNKKIHIFLIDDDEDDREIFCEVLSSIDPLLCCETALHGKDALTKLSSLPEQPGLIFLDLNMPIMNGLEFLSEVKKNPKLNKIPIVVYTTSDDQKIKSAVKTMGAQDYLTKPADHEVLKKKLEGIINKYDLLGD